MKESLLKLFFNKQNIYFYIHQLLFWLLIYKISNQKKGYDMMYRWFLSNINDAILASKHVLSIAFLMSS